MRNGWNVPLVDMTVKWDMFAKTGKVASSAVLLRSGEIDSISLRPHGKGQYQTEFVEFRGQESGFTGFTGHKYYGYRLRLYYKGTLVKVVARPGPLADWDIPEEDN